MMSSNALADSLAGFGGLTVAGVVVSALVSGLVVLLLVVYLARAVRAT